MNQLSFDGFGDLPPASENETVALSGVLNRIEQHLANSKRWGLLSSEEVMSLSYLLLRLLDGPEEEAKDALVSHIVGKQSKAQELSIGGQAASTLLRKVLERHLRYRPEVFEDARIAVTSAEQIARGFQEVRDALEAEWLMAPDGQPLRIVSSQLIQHFPNFSKLVYGDC
jgi:hypothetical protein